MILNLDSNRHVLHISGKAVQRFVQNIAGFAVTLCFGRKIGECVRDANGKLRSLSAFIKSRD
jgi:hypothetical protein